MTSFQTGARTRVSGCYTYTAATDVVIVQCSPGHAVHSLLVDRRYEETHRGHHGLASGAVQDLPLEGLGVVEEGTLVSFMDSDLKSNPGRRVTLLAMRATAERSARSPTSTCLKSQTA